jgi:hypothetical protein
MQTAVEFFSEAPLMFALLLLCVLGIAWSGSKLAWFISGVQDAIYYSNRERFPCFSGNSWWTIMGGKITGIYCAYSAKELDRLAQKYLFKNVLIMALSIAGVAFVFPMLK